ncbi:MAG TPA: response regulator [Verrucomicrobiae bacterium]|nr:response regulator [Verrucomicrobiae bacterium]
MPPIRILLIEDNPDDALLTRARLLREKSFDCTLTHATRLTEGLALLDQQPFDVVLTDLGLPDSQGLPAFTELQNKSPGMPIVVLTGQEDMGTALAAIKMGAQDFLPKSELTGFLLARTLRYAIERKQTELVLATKEEMLRLFIRHTPAAIAVLDTDMRYLVVSDRWVKDYHHEGKEIIGRSHYELFPDLPERWKEGHRRALAGAVEKSDEDQGRIRSDGSFDWLKWELRPWRKPTGEIGGVIFFVEIITERKEREAEREKLITDLQAALAEVKTLSGMLPICASCKKVRDDHGYWSQIETYIARHTAATFSHGLCPHCLVKEYEAGGLPVPESLRAAVKK